MPALTMHFQQSKHKLDDKQYTHLKSIGYLIVKTYNEEIIKTTQL